MNAADFNELSEAEKKHFYKCQQCLEMVDMRQLDDVLFHEDHIHSPDIQYGGSEELWTRTYTKSGRVKIIAASIWFPMRCHSVGSGKALESFLIAEWWRTRPSFHRAKSCTHLPNC